MTKRIEDILFIVLLVCDVAFGCVETSLFLLNLTDDFFSSHSRKNSPKSKDHNVKVTKGDDNEPLFFGTCSNIIFLLIIIDFPLSSLLYPC